MGLNATDDSEDGIAVYLKRNPDTCFVAEDEDEIVGIILSGHDGRRGYIYHMAVKLSCRNQGVGNSGNIIYIDPTNNLVVSVASFFKPTVFDRVDFIENIIKPYILDL